MPWGWSQAGFSSWALFVTLASAAGVAVSFVAGRRRHFSAGFLAELALVVILAGWLSAKVAHVLFEARGHELAGGRVASGVVDLLREDPWHWARLFDAGHVFYGGVIGGVGVGLLFAWRSNETRLAALFDVAAPGIVVGIALGRVGCFFGGCCYGRETTLPWAVHFPAGHATHGVGVHPVQLYDVAVAVALLVLLAVWRPAKDGLRFAAVAAVYAAARFCTEFVRADADRGFVGMLSTSQAISIIVFCVVALLVLRADRGSLWKRL